mmetsp:Transcript_14840/g.36034  ORF Transcript_14840/g.36034 Transcript_14840/m.36034 type:complete len:738 (+) Transcript_14840:1650-3863(+)
MSACESFSMPGTLPPSLDLRTAFAAHSRGCGPHSHTLVLTTDLDSPCSRCQTSECRVAHVVGFNDSAASAPLFDSLEYFLHGIHYFDTPVEIRTASDTSIYAIACGRATFQCLNSVCGKLIVVSVSQALLVRERLPAPLVNFPDIHDGGNIRLFRDHFILEFPHATLSLTRDAGSTLQPMLIRPGCPEALMASIPSHDSQSTGDAHISPHSAQLASAVSTPVALLASRSRRDRDLPARRRLAAARAGYIGSSQEKVLLSRADATDYLPKAIPTSRSTGDLLGKMTRASFPSKRHRHQEHGLVVAFDTSGPHSPAPDVTADGRTVRYMLILIDLGSDRIWSYYLATKGEAASILRKHFHKFGAPKFVRSDNAPEFLGHEMQSVKTEFNLVQWQTCTYTSEQNPAERAIRSIQEKSSTLAANSNVDPDFGWPLLAFVATFLLNIEPKVHRPGQPTPWEACYGEPWNYKMDRVPLSRAFVHMRSRNKFATHALVGLYLGRAETSFLKNGYVCLLVETGKLVVSPSVYVQENVFPIFNEDVYQSHDEDTVIPLDIHSTPASRIDNERPPVPPSQDRAAADPTPVTDAEDGHADDGDPTGPVFTLPVHHPSLPLARPRPSPPSRPHSVHDDAVTPLRPLSARRDSPATISVSSPAPASTVASPSPLTPGARTPPLTSVGIPVDRSPDDKSAAPVHAVPIARRRPLTSIREEAPASSEIIQLYLWPLGWGGQLCRLRPLAHSA